jgi:hypothetical protein
LTHETTCASEMSKKTTCENLCQKRPPTSGGTPWPGDTWHVPPRPVAAGPCRRCHRRHVGSGRPGGPCMPGCRQWWWRHGHATSPAANGGGGMVLPRHLPPMVMAAWCCHLTSIYRIPGCRRWQRRQGPAATGPGGTCHVSPGQGVPPLVGGLF